MEPQLAGRVLIHSFTTGNYRTALTVRLGALAKGDSLVLKATGLTIRVIDTNPRRGVATVSLIRTAENKPPS